MVISWFDNVFVLKVIMSWCETISYIASYRWWNLRKWIPFTCRLQKYKEKWSPQHTSRVQVVRKLQQPNTKYFINLKCIYFHHKAHKHTHTQPYLAPFATQFINWHADTCQKLKYQIFSKLEIKKNGFYLNLLWNSITSRFEKENGCHKRFSHFRKWFFFCSIQYRPMEFNI